MHHFGFWVDDIDAIHERAKAAGVTVMVDPSERGADSAAYGEPPGRFVRAMFVNDPDGNVIQFDQRVD
jgi:catechol 2,3-dioxygenase-like lactoylglutathione lyase family enzyme